MKPKNSETTKQAGLVGQVWSSFCDEFKAENFSLNFNTNRQFMKYDPEFVLEYFHSPMWSFCNRLVYLIYRIGIAIYYTIWFVESIIRNVQYRGTLISGKKTTSVLLLHPWYMYMTSWSLTILLLHLWISAFIVFYFYSLEKKSYLRTFFSYIFGPFSCSKISTKSSINDKEKLADSYDNSKSNDKSNYYQKFLNLFARKSGHDVSLGELNNQTSIVNASNLNHSNQQEADVLNPFIVNLTNNQNDLDNEGVEEDVEKKLKLNKTYCNFESQCQLPSSSVTSDAESWKLWYSHVPCFIVMLIKISWLLYNIIIISAILVTIGYFTYVSLYDLEVEPDFISEIGNFHRHGINSVVAIIDVALLAYPVRLLHFAYTSFYGWLYAFTSFIYWYQNPQKNIIYEQIDYNKPFKMIGLFVFLTVLTFFMQLIHYTFYKFKLFIKRKCNI